MFDSDLHAWQWAIKAFAGAVFLIAWLFMNGRNRLDDHFNF